MKSFKLLAASLLAAASLSGVASATTVKITGSSAFRKALYCAIVNQLGNGTVKVGYTGNAALASANQATFTNGTDTVQCCIAGSVGGINWVINDLDAATDKDRTHPETAWISTSGSGSWGTASITGSGTTFSVTGGSQIATPTLVWEAAAPADITMSDSYQDSTAYDSVTTNVALVEPSVGSVGVVTFLFGKGIQHPDIEGISAGSYNRLSNITALQFQALAANGILPLKFFTGNAGDAAIDVVLIGRDNDSGTRLGAFAETAYGNVDKPATQFRVLDSGGNNFATGGTSTIASLTFEADGISGYASGGHVKNALNSSVASGTTDAFGNKFILVSYLGTGDAPTNTISYNGVGYSVNSVTAGQYSFWTYEHMYYKDTLVGSAKETLANAIATGLHDTYAPASGVRMDDMGSTFRGGEGTVITP